MGKVFKIFHIENVLEVVVNIKSLASRKHMKFPQNISVFEAEILIIKGLQITSFSDEIEAVIEGKSPPLNSFFIAFETNSRWAGIVTGRRTDSEDKKWKTERANKDARLSPCYHYQRTPDCPTPCQTLSYLHTPSVMAPYWRRNQDNAEARGRVRDVCYTSVLLEYKTWYVNQVVHSSYKRGIPQSGE